MRGEGEMEVKTTLMLRPSGLLILDSNRYARDPNRVSSAIPKMVENLEGEILADRLWNEQRLAYPIRGQRKGTYWLTYFRMDSSSVAKLNREMKLNENVLRSLVIKVDPRLVDAMVEHAQGGASSEDTSSAAKNIA